MTSKKICIIALIFIFAIGVFLGIWNFFKPHGNTVRILQDDKVLYTIDLNKSEDRIIEVEYKGRKNIIQIKNHEIFVIEADCPDKTCIKTGKLTSVPIICMPNHLIIEYAESN